MWTWLRRYSIVIEIPLISCAIKHWSWSNVTCGQTPTLAPTSCSTSGRLVSPVFLPISFLYYFVLCICGGFFKSHYFSQRRLQQWLRNWVKQEDRWWAILYPFGLWGSNRCFVAQVAIILATAKMVWSWKIVSKAVSCFPGFLIVVHWSFCNIALGVISGGSSWSLILWPFQYF